ncbi:MAG: saccharopine dehydrogenase family protein [Oculatellaceae cyanobacterium Prado106]|jgi:saccharopine dehydrogenase (NAD+, L-lysine-forming)|nr:saccharopine dehydrogenase family protein [Oculatellaceae cyanobacterium Prado106]
MAKVLIIGAGGVGNVVAQKCAQVQSVFSEILLASRTREKCDAIASTITHPAFSTAQVDADQASEVAALIRDFQPDMVINVALPYQDLPIMDACLETGVHYLDTANYEPLHEAKFEYKWQWDYHDRYKQAGIMAVLGCGFDPGVTGVFTAYAQKHYFDEIHTLDIVDCNAGDHGQPFATNFNPEINIREITQRGRYYEQGRWIETEPLTVHRPIHYPEIGARESYLLYHEELESLVKHFPTLKSARFWMTFSENYINHLRVLENVGLTRIDTIEFEGQQIVPLKFLKAVLPEPSSLGENYEGKTSIGCHIQGIKNGRPRSYYIYNNCDHAATYREIGAQAISYTTGVPAMLGALLVLTGEWQGKGVFNVEQLNPDPFLEKLGEYGLPWHEQFDTVEQYIKSYSLV